jgi:hypothetical protein
VSGSPALHTAYQAVVDAMKTAVACFFASGRKTFVALPFDPCGNGSEFVALAGNSAAVDVVAGWSVCVSVFC